MTFSRCSILLSVLGVLASTAAACDDDPFFIEWVSNPQPVVLYSLDVEKKNQPSAFDFVRRQRVLVEAPGATGAWDVVVATSEGSLVFLTPEVFGIDSEAAVAPRPGLSLDEVEEAPAADEFVADEPVPVEVGSSYVVRTRQDRGGAFSLVCVFYGKFEVVEADAVTGVVSFVYDVNPRCEDPGLVPDTEAGEGDEETGGDEEEQTS